MDILTGCFGGLNNERLIKSGITSSNFSVMEDVNEDVFKNLKVGDNVEVIFGNKKYKCEVAYKYRDKKDIKINIKGVVCLDI